MNINLRVAVITIIIAVCNMCSHSTTAQQVWTLQQCIDYATDNSIDIQQQKLRCKAQEQQLNTTKLSALPDVNGSVSQQFSFGRATGLDNIIVDRNQMMTGFGVSASMPIFTGLRMTNQVKADEFSLQAALAQLDAAKEDIELNVTSYYLQALYYRSLIDVAEKQLKLSEEQVRRTTILVENGKVSETELFDQQSQLAVDIQNFTECVNNYHLALMDLAQTMNVADIDNFDIAVIEQKV
jgi:Outer membrane protein